MFSGVLPRQHPARTAPAGITARRGYPAPSLPGEQVGRGHALCRTPHRPGVSKEEVPVKAGCGPRSVNLGTANAP